MIKEDKGITIIVLIITIVVLLILTGEAVKTLKGDSGVASEARDSRQETEKESIKQKIEADLFNEKIKKGRELTTEESNNIIERYGEIIAENKLKTKGKDRSYEIPLNEIIGAKTE